MVTHYLAFDPHNCNLPNKVYAISTTSDSPSPPKKGLWDIWSQLLVTWNFFLFKPTSAWVKSPQAKIYWSPQAWFLIGYSIFKL